MEGLAIEDFEQLFSNRGDRVGNELGDGVDLSDDFLALKESIASAFQTKVSNGF